MRIAIVVAIACAPVTAAAEPLDLRLHRLPHPGLRMRTAQAEPAPVDEPALPAPVRSVTRAGAEIAKLVRQTTDDETVPLHDRLVLRVDLGLAVDGARLSGNPTLDGQDLSMLRDRDYDSVRSYGLGEIYLGTRGIGAASLTTYAASHLRFAQTLEAARPILSPYETVPDFQGRTGWIQGDGMFSSKWLAPIRIRAGRMYVYGPTIVHVDGVLIAWESSWLELSTWNGLRVADFRARSIDAPSQDLDRQDAVNGSELRADLRRFDLPVVVGLSSMVFNGHAHSDVSATLVPREDVVIRSSSRFQDGSLARQRLVVRARVSEDSTIIVDNQLRTRADWFWDYASLAATPGDGDLDVAARRYLDMGEQRPRLQTALQAGTVLAQNLDLLARGAVALDVDPDQAINANPHLPEYIEGGAGIEVRLRRALALTSSALIRDYKRPPPHAVDTDGVADPLPDIDELGEEWLIEGGVAARYTAGARRFSAMAELYGRRTRWVPLYEVAGERLEVVDFHGGGRFFVDAWVNPRVRLRVEYDLSTLVEQAPEFRGLKQLRMWIEGTY